MSLLEECMFRSKPSGLSRTIVALCLVCFTCQIPILRAQTPAKFDLTIDNIMRGTEMIGTVPAQIRWSQDSQRVYFTWKQPGEARDKDPDLYVVNRDGSGLRKLSEEEAKKAPPANGELSKDKKWTLFTENGDIFLYDHTRGERKQLTRTDDAEINPHFTQDQRHIYFTRSSNLFVMSLEDGSIAQMTEVRPAQGAGGAPTAGAGFGGGRGFQGADADQTADEGQGGRGSGGGQRGGGQGAQNQGQAAGQQRGSESQDWVKKEETDLFDVVKEREKRREEQDAQRKKRETIKPFQLQAQQSLQQMQLSPDGKYVIAAVVENANGSKNTVVPNYVSDSAYTEDIPGRTKVGDIQSRFRLVSLSTENGAVAWVDHGQRAVGNQAENIQFGYNTAQLADDEGDVDQDMQDRGQTGQRGAAQRDRDVRLFLPVWSEDGTKAVINARSGDNKDRWILSLDAATGKTKVIATMHDDAWIGGPGENTVGWMPDNQHVYYEDEEKTGYAQLYTVSIDGGEPTALTTGKYEVFNPQISQDKTKWFFTSSEVHPGERQFYSMPLNGGPHTRVTPMAGSNQAELSPDETMIANVYSYTNKPPELYLQENKPNAEPKQITTSPTAEWLSYKWIDPPVITFKSRDVAD